MDSLDPYSLDALLDQSLRSAYWHYKDDNTINSEKMFTAQQWEAWRLHQRKGNAQS